MKLLAVEAMINIGLRFAGIGSVEQTVTLIPSTSYSLHSGSTGSDICCCCVESGATVADGKTIKVDGDGRTLS